MHAICIHGVYNISSRKLLHEFMRGNMQNETNYTTLDNFWSHAHKNLSVVIMILTDCPSYCFIIVTGSWKTYLVAIKQISEKAIKVFQICFQYQFLLHIVIKQLLNFLAVKFETCNSFLLGNTVVCIPFCRCAKKVGFPRSGHNCAFAFKWELHVNMLILAKHYHHSVMSFMDIIMIK